jgi:hypothetical protein
MGRDAVGTALSVSGKPRTAVPGGALAIAHENVWFRSSDGLQLAGWYVPSHALRVHPQAYDAGVSRFFDHALRPR